MKNHSPNFPFFITNAERAERLKKLPQMIKEAGQQAIVLTPGSNLRYFFGTMLHESERFIGAVVTADSTTFICPKFKDTSLVAKLPIQIETLYWEEDEDPYGMIASLLVSHSVNHCAVNCSPSAFDRQMLVM